MPNPNVNRDELTKLITGCRAHTTHDETGRLVDPIVAGVIADWLISQPTPVLVISDAVLTDEVVVRLPEVQQRGCNQDIQHHEAEQFRSVLSRLAKGETT